MRELIYEPIWQPDLIERIKQEFEMYEKQK
jgi:hypothetical protein